MEDVENMSCITMIYLANSFDISPGIAHLSGVCRSDMGINSVISESTTTDFTRTITVVAHELGHKYDIGIVLPCLLF